ncbi:integrase catalytic domain-containing protein [Trichonephila clavata]|uniref:Integrase catalytic domain-containing protein n=1 Tax=Trichonephila clavata TaxID=2740835 RepID=A0A8X6JL72_TRICU|nr:integrase catalytic domain-containing protein [Trichonephila clavata]
MCCESDNYDNSESDIVPVFNCALNKPILNIEDFSTLRRLLRVTSFVFRFIYNARNSNNRRSGPITSSETSKALIYFIKMSQENSFSSEINNIKLNKSVNKNSKLCNFNVMIDDDNILRIKSRLTNSSLDVYEKHPIILSNDYFASLIVYDCHEQVLHNGVNETLIQVRSKFWILKARQFIKSIVYNCRVCKKFHVKSGQQNIAPLPNDRIEKSQPFETTGVDFAGPLYLKEGSKIISENVFFFKEYLLELRSVMFTKQSKNIPNLKIDDVVLIREDNVKRYNWKLGRIKKLFPGRDGKVRSCEIQLSKGVIKRPVERLYNLEVKNTG